jgi:hypothetical protein
VAQGDGADFCEGCFVCRRGEIMIAKNMNEISKKKLNYPINEHLAAYLKDYERVFGLPLRYEDLLRFKDSYPLLDKNGEDTLWESVYYPEYLRGELFENLKIVYALLKAGGDISVVEHLTVDRVDFCVFGNSKPFRIRIVNEYNDNHDYFYVKRADASRIYGLELEHLLSPNRINYLVNLETLVEEHIYGIPGDVFLKHHLEKETMNHVRLAKEFVKFNERCFVKLLGDMRSYNYVVDITQDFDGEQYRVRAIDFDQQCYEGRKNMYLPQFFKENVKVVELCLQLMNSETFKQYQQEERSLMVRRLKSARHRLKDLIDCMRKDTISTPEKIKQLKMELSTHHDNKDFLKCKNMGDILKLHLRILLTNLRLHQRKYIHRVD